MEEKKWKGLWERSKWGCVILQKCLADCFLGAKPAIAHPYLEGASVSVKGDWPKGAASIAVKSPSAVAAVYDRRFIVQAYPRLCRES